MKLSDEMKSNCRYPDCGLCTQDGFCNDQKYIPKVEALEKEIELLKSKYANLLDEAKYLYAYDPNNFRYTTDEYFKEYELGESNDLSNT